MGVATGDDAAACLARSRRFAFPLTPMRVRKHEFEQMVDRRWLVAMVLMSGSLAVAQDSNATVTQDVFVVAYYPDTNYALEDFTLTGSGPGDDWEELTYIQFDLSPLPEGMHVENATLQLFNHYMEWTNRNYTDFGIKAVTSAWDENDVTFATRPTLDDTVVYDPQRFQGENSGGTRSLTRSPMSGSTGTSRSSSKPGRTAALRTTDSRWCGMEMMAKRGPSIHASVRCSISTMSRSGRCST